MFDAVAPRYDRTNAVLSLGLDRTWRSAVVAALRLQPGLRVLDLAAGTATSTRALARSGAKVVGCDFSPGMLAVAAGRPDPPPLVAGDGLALPFADGSFDRVTISFGLRNVADPAACLAELFRVTAPGGLLVVCEFSQPTWAPLRAVYGDYLMRALPALARRVASNPAAYVYLAESIRAWPDQRRLAGWLTAAGWAEVSWRDLTGGIVALHRGAKPLSSSVTTPMPAPNQDTAAHPPAE
jgi:demethylmenaquinone methyltransferase/2-methoxy-6-polyprenyl-1,4-benzoquinol methylase